MYALPNITGVSCLWSGYSAWSGCSSSCGVGVQRRKRKILQPAGEGGKECEGNAEETRPCQSAPCPVDCEWANYGAWSTCTKTCGGGTRKRRRSIKRRAQSGGKTCPPGDSEEVKFCKTKACPKGEVYLREDRTDLY